MRQTGGAAGSGSGDGKVQRPEGSARSGEPSRKPEERREPLSRERIVAAAISIVDRQGLDGLSMRRLGTELGGFEAMSLYRYFASKADLIDAVLAGVWAEMKLPEDEPDPWERLRKLAWSWRALAHAHPNVFHLLAARSVRAPSALRPIEFAFRTFKDAGFGEEQAGHAFLTEVGYVYGYSLREIRGEGAPNFDVGRLPAGFGVISELARYFGHLDADRAFEWGLRVVIHGLRAELESSRPADAGAYATDASALAVALGFVPPPAKLSFSGGAGGAEPAAGSSSSGEAGGTEVPPGSSLPD